MSRKTCKRCGIDKDIDDFSRLRTSKDGRQPKCRECDRIMNAEWRARNTDKRREYFAQERFVENRKRYKKDRPDVVRLADVRRRERKYGSASELSALDRERIRHIYAFRDWMTAKTGVRFEVDHVIPLARGGKHHPDNLQLLTAAANRRKGCKISAIQ